jgi:hypothetical protein
VNARGAAFDLRFTICDLRFFSHRKRMTMRLLLAEMPVMIVSPPHDTQSNGATAGAFVFGSNLTPLLMGGTLSLNPSPGSGEGNILGTGA